MWIVRQSYGALIAYVDKPEKLTKRGIWNGVLEGEIILKRELFPEIKWYRGKAVWKRLIRPEWMQEDQSYVIYNSNYNDRPQKKTK